MFEENDNIFPAKPELQIEQDRSKNVRFVLSLLVFVAAFLLFFSESYVLITELVLVLLIHELGHLIFMKMYGYKSLNMLFIPFLGAVVSGENVKVSQRQKVIISLMGPIPGILIGAILFVVAAQAGVPDVYLTEAALMFMVINVLNLVPIDPLDGGKVVEALFFPSNEQIKMYFTLISSLLIIIIGFYTNMLLITAFGFFMAVKVRGYQRKKAIHDELDELDLDYTKPYRELSDREYWTIRKVFLNNNPKIKDVIPADFQLWENENLIVDQVNQLLRIKIVEDLKSWQKVFFLLLLLAGIALPFVVIYQNPDLINWYIDHVSSPNG